MFGLGPESASSALEFFVDCLEPDKDPVINMLFHTGDHAYPLLSDPEELGRQIREIIAVLSEKLEMDADPGERMP